MSPHVHHVTALEDRVPIQQKIAYGLGALVTIVAVNSVVQLTSLVYVVGLGVSAVWIGYAQAFPRLWDAIIDPILGNFSDNCRSRHGRRIPFLVVGGILIGFAFWLLWTVPHDWSQEGIFAYFVVVSLFFYTVVPVYAIPHGALGLEMTSDYHERTSLFAFASFIGNVGALTLPWVYFLANRPIFGGDTVNGIKWICLGMSVILTAAAMICAFVCKEGKLKQARAQERVPIIESFRTTYRNGTFVRLVAVFVLLIVGFQLVMGFNNFITIFYLYGGHTEAASRLMAHNGTLWALVGIAGVAPMTWYAKRFGKRVAVISALWLIIGGNLSKIVCYNPQLPYLSMIPTVCLSLGMVVAFSLVNAMIADICDEDELVTGIRREGIYFAVYNWWWKVAVSVATIISGYLQRYTGFVEGATTQSDATLFWLRAWEIGLPPLLCLISVALLLEYPLTEARAYEIQSLLKARKAGKNPR
ncbi:MAG: MFS transporter [Methylococcaceae bacterium]|nr:MFS transporter [Methylococcaceae bacterium]